MQQVQEGIQKLGMELEKAHKLESVESVDKWAEVFVYKVAEICRPDYLVEFRKKCNPQEEESKDDVKFDQKLIESVNQFAEVVTEIEIEIKTELATLEHKLQSLAVHEVDLNKSQNKFKINLKKESFLNDANTEY